MADLSVLAWIPAWRWNDDRMSKLDARGVENAASAVAEDEVRRRRERMHAALKTVVSAGWYQPGICPTGYLHRVATRRERAGGAPRLVLESTP